MKSVAQIVEDQAKKWNMMKIEEKKEEPGIPVITVSREPGSGGRLVGEKLAEKLGMDLFHQEIMHEMAKSANVSGRLLETVDEKGLAMIDDWISALVDSRHLWPDQYMQHLLKVIGTLAKHGAAVLIGRGANFVIPREKRFSIRIVAPMEFRAQNVSKEFGVSVGEARRRVSRTDSDRKAFVRKYFHADIANPMNYDMVINTEIIGIDESVAAVTSALGK